jgi:alpha-beta hydrolase superfamily lysophospholipase
VIHEEGELEGVGGVRLYRQAWLPDAEPKAVVVLAHGASEHSGRYAWVGAQLAGSGYAVHALDHRGHGKSGKGAYVDRLRHAVEDLDRLVTFAGEQHPGTRVFLLGHSFGGCLAIEYAVAHQDRLAGLLLSAPLAALEAAPLALRIAARTLSAVAPRTGVYAVDSSAVSTDPQVVADYDADPLNHHGKIPARTIAEIANAVAGFHEHAPAITVPLLVMHSPADRITLFSGSEMVHDRAGSQDKTFIRYDGLAHEILNEPERQRVIDDITRWLDERV